MKTQNAREIVAIFTAVSLAFLQAVPAGFAANAPVDQRQSQSVSTQPAVSATEGQQPAQQAPVAKMPPTSIDSLMNTGGIVKGGDVPPPAKTGAVPIKVITQAQAILGSGVASGTLLRPSRITNAPAVYSFFDAKGTRLGSVSINAQTHDQTWTNAAGQRVATALADGSSTTFYRYNWGSLPKLQAPAGAMAFPATLKQYDAQGGLIREIVMNENGDPVKMTVYGSVPVSQLPAKVAILWAGTPNLRAEVYYDAQGKIVSTTYHDYRFWTSLPQLNAPAGSIVFPSTLKGYDAQGTLIRELVMDASGKPVSLIVYGSTPRSQIPAKVEVYPTGSNQPTSTLQYNPANGRLVSVASNDAQGQAVSTIYYNHTAWDNLPKLLAPAGSMVFPSTLKQYDANGKLIREFKMGTDGAILSMTVYGAVPGTQLPAKVVVYKQGSQDPYSEIQYDAQGTVMNVLRYQQITRAAMIQAIQRMPGGVERDRTLAAVNSAPDGTKFYKVTAKNGDVTYQWSSGVSLLAQYAKNLTDAAQLAQFNVAIAANPNAQFIAQVDSNGGQSWSWMSADGKTTYILNHVQRATSAKVGTQQTNVFRVTAQSVREWSFEALTAITADNVAAQGDTLAADQKQELISGLNQALGQGAVITKTVSGNTIIYSWSRPGDPTWTRNIEISNGQLQYSEQKKMNSVQLPDGVYGSAQAKLTSAELDQLNAALSDAVPNSQFSTQTGTDGSQSWTWTSADGKTTYNLAKAMVQEMTGPDTYQTVEAWSFSAEIQVSVDDVRAQIGLIPNSDARTMAGSSIADGVQLFIKVTSGDVTTYQWKSSSNGNVNYAIAVNSRIPVDANGNFKTEGSFSKQESVSIEDAGTYAASVNADARQSFLDALAQAKTAGVTTVTKTTTGTGDTAYSWQDPNISSKTYSVGINGTGQVNFSIETRIPRQQISPLGVAVSVNPVVSAPPSAVQVVVPTPAPMTGPTDSQFIESLKVNYNITLNATVPIPMAVKEGINAALAMFPNVLVRNVAMSYGPVDSPYATVSMAGGRDMKINSNVLSHFNGTEQELADFAKYVMTHETWHMVVGNNIVTTAAERRQLAYFGLVGHIDPHQQPSQYAAMNQWEFVAEVGARVVFAQNPQNTPGLQAAPKQDLLTWLTRDNGQTDQCRQVALILMGILARAQHSSSVQTFDRTGAAVTVSLMMDNKGSVAGVTWQGRVFSYRMKIG